MIKEAGFEDIKGWLLPEGKSNLPHVDNTPVTEEQKAKGLAFLERVFTTVNSEIEYALGGKNSDAWIEQVKASGLTTGDLEFIKELPTNKMFLLGVKPGTPFVKLSSGKFIDAETYIKRLESGLITQNKNYNRAQEKITEFEGLTAFQLFKRSLTKLFGGKRA